VTGILVGDPTDGVPAEATVKIFTAQFMGPLFKPLMVKLVSAFATVEALLQLRNVHFQFFIGQAGRRQNLQDAVNFPGLNSLFSFLTSEDMDLHAKAFEWPNRAMGAWTKNPFRQFNKSAVLVHAHPEINDFRTTLSTMSDNI
jgi:hypothetical protein